MKGRKFLAITRVRREGTSRTEHQQENGLLVKTRPVADMRYM
jgi:hypothetical protein